MRRADRLSQIVQHLRGGRLVTAQKLGEWLEVSERTIYRDIADLQSTGVPIDGEAGVGYLMRERLARTARAAEGAQALGS
jgi:predicted DNA-binding transcriptional regulator YafY